MAMKLTRFVLTATALLVLSCTMIGCGESRSERIVGIWEGQIELQEAAVQKELDGAAADPNRLKVLRERFDQMRKTVLNVRFKETGQMDMTADIGPISQDASFTWEITERDGDKVNIKSVESQGAEEQLQVVFLDDDTFTMDAPGDNPNIGLMRFHRLR
jgi:hypothetical protein